MSTRPAQIKACSVPDCGGPHHSHGLCDKHRTRLRAHGSVDDWTDTRTPIERWWAFVDIRGYGCWEWTGGRNGRGYGVFHYQGRTRIATRAYFTLTQGPLPRGVCVLHRCDNPPCVRPDHLFLGTHKDNTADMQAKGRGNYATGERVRNAKLTRAAVEEIRRRHAVGEKYTTLASEFNVTVPAIRYACVQGWRS